MIRKKNSSLCNVFTVVLACLFLISSSAWACPGQLDALRPLSSANADMPVSLYGRLITQPGSSATGGLLEERFLELEGAVSAEDKARIFGEIIQLEMPSAVGVTIQAEAAADHLISIPAVNNFHRRMLLFEAMLWWIRAQGALGFSVKFEHAAGADISYRDLRDIWTIIGFDYEGSGRFPFRIAKTGRQARAEELLSKADSQMWDIGDAGKWRVKNIPRVSKAGERPRILLISSIASRRGVTGNRKQGRFVAPNFGHYRLKAFLENNNYADVDVFNPEIFASPQIAYRRLISLFLERRYHIVGFSPTHSNLINDLSMAYLLKKIDGMMEESGNPVFIAGGNEATHLIAEEAPLDKDASPINEPGYFLKHSPFDFVALGYGEKLLARIAEAVSSGEGIPVQDFLREAGTRGVAYINANGLLVTKAPLPLTHEEFQEYTYSNQPIASMPYRRHWIHSALFISPSDIRFRQARLRCARLFFTTHCAKANACGFCRNRLLHGQPLLGLSAEDMAEMVKAAVSAHNPEAIFLNDDDALMGGSRRGRARFIEFCRRLIELKKKGEVPDSLEFYMQTRSVSFVNMAGGTPAPDMELIGYMKRAGFVMVALGIESFSERLLQSASINKLTTVQVHKTAIDGLLAGGITPQLNIVGLPPEAEKEDVIATIEESLSYALKGAQLALTTYIWYLPNNALARNEQYRDSSLDVDDITIPGTDISYRYKKRYLPLSPEIRAITEEGNIWSNADGVWDEFLSNAKTAGIKLPFRYPSLMARVLTIFIAELELLGEEEKAREVRAKTWQIIRQGLSGGRVAAEAFTGSHPFRPAALEARHDYSEAIRCAA